MKYALQDDLGRAIGITELPRGSAGKNVEYGYRRRDGIPFVEGIAEVVRISDLPQWLRDEIEANDIAEVEAF